MRYFLARLFTILQNQRAKVLHFSEIRKSLCDFLEIISRLTNMAGKFRSIVASTKLPFGRMTAKRLG